MVAGTTGPSAGFDQNRLYLGVGRQLTDYLRLEVDYLRSSWRATAAPTIPLATVASSSWHSTSDAEPLATGAPWGP